MDPENVKMFLKDLFRREDLWVIGANLQYELEALSCHGIDFHKSTRFVDIQIAETLLDETLEFGSYQLESLCEKYLGEGKDEKLLRAAADAHGIDPKRDLWRLHSKYVGPYGEYDAWAPVEIFKKQLPLLEADELLPIFEIESRLVPLLWEMRKIGVRVDLDAAHKLTRELLELEEQARHRAKKQWKRDVDEWSGPCIASICDELGIQYPRTSKGNCSFTKEWLAAHDHRFLKDVEELRQLNRLRTTFIDDWIFKNEIKGVIHPQWKQLKSDEGGTKTGRMAAANPNPQQVPARSDIAPKVRALFIPMEDDQKWAKIDYSQQEPRILVHYAHICKHTGADLVRMAYQQNKDMDIYQFLGQAANISRKNAKDITLGRCYGMGVAKLASKLGIGMETAKQLLNDFDGHVPFVREISESCMRKAQERGWIKTLGGRKRHFNLWEPADAYQMRLDGKDVRPRRIEAAKASWPGKRLQRAEVHKALNSLIQGSAADMTKIAMLTIWDRHGLVPYLQVHDELDYGVKDEQHAMILQDAAETCINMTVPIKADLSVGEHWK